MMSLQEEQRRADLMARAEPRQEDLQWEELEEADGEGEGEGEKDEGLDGGEGGKDRESKDRTAEGLCSHPSLSKQHFLKHVIICTRNSSFVLIDSFVWSASLSLSVSLPPVLYSRFG